jgi:ATP-binding cassette, subfamily B, multidrug efflux pump
MFRKLLNRVIDTRLLGRVLSLVKPFKKLFFVCFGLAVVFALLAPVTPYLVQVTVDKYIMQNNWHMLQTMAIALISVLIVQGFVQYNFTYWTSYLGQSIIKNLRTRTFNHIVKLNLRYFDKTPIGTSTTRTINDIEAINDVFSEGIISILSDLLTVLVVITIMFVLNWKLALICMTVMPLLLIATYIFKEGIRKSFTDVRIQVARLNAFMQEHVTGMSVVQIFNAEEQEMKKFKVINAGHRDANIRSNWYYSIFFPVVEIILAIATGLLVWNGANQVISHYATLGTLLAFIMYLNLMFRPIRMLADKFNTLQMGMVAADRVFKIIDNDEQLEKSGKFAPQIVEGKIEFKEVWFAYDGENFVLKNVSFKVESGKTLAIVGATGAGKTSIISVLSKFYDIQKGHVLVDDKDIRQWQLQALRSQIALVLQDVFLFSGSIMDNITLHNESISREQVIHAANVAGVNGFIEKLPGGYDYNVMERGATLSLGQRQLISFVRALVFNPKILILDEATSSIDTESEMLIQNAINKLVTNRTSIIIAHRLSTIQKADSIIVLEHGEIKEQGSHKQLLALNGYYKHLYEMQFIRREKTTALS